MSIMRKLGTLIRGKATEAGEAVVDKHAITILEQEIRDARTHLDQSRHSLTKVMADKTMATRQHDELKQQAEEWLEHARNAKEKGDMPLAEECASKVANLRDQAAIKEEEVNALNLSVTQLEQTINDTAGQIKQVEQRINSIKANDRVQRAQASLSRHANQANGSMTSALDTLDRIESKQQHRSAQLDAAQKISRDPDADLKDRLAQVGIGKSKTSAASVLDEL